MTLIMYFYDLFNVTNITYMILFYYCLRWLRFNILLKILINIFLWKSNESSIQYFRYLSNLLHIMFCNSICINPNEYILFLVFVNYVDLLFIDTFDRSRFRFFMRWHKKAIFFFFISLRKIPHAIGINEQRFIKFSRVIFYTVGSCLEFLLYTQKETLSSLKIVLCNIYWWKNSKYSL